MYARVEYIQETSPGSRISRTLARTGMMTRQENHQCGSSASFHLLMDMAILVAQICTVKHQLCVLNHIECSYLLNEWCFKPRFCTVNLHCAGDNLGEWDEFCYESCSWGRIDRSTCWPVVQRATTVPRMPPSGNPSPYALKCFMLTLAKEAIYSCLCYCDSWNLFYVQIVTKDFYNNNSENTRLSRYTIENSHTIQLHRLRDW